MEGQFGGKPKPPSWLWQMIKICFVLLTRYPQITTQLLALQTQAPRPPLDRCATSLLLFLLISTKPRRCHWHLVEMQGQRMSFKVPFGSRMPPSAEMHPPGGWGTHETLSLMTPGAGKKLGVCFPHLTPGTSLLSCMCLQNKEGLTRLQLVPNRNALIFPLFFL